MVTSESKSLDRRQMGRLPLVAVVCIVIITLNGLVSSLLGQRDPFAIQAPTGDFRLGLVWPPGQPGIGGNLWVNLAGAIFQSVLLCVIVVVFPVRVRRMVNVLHAAPATTLLRLLVMGVVGSSVILALLALSLFSGTLGVNLVLILGVGALALDIALGSVALAVGEAIAEHVGGAHSPLLVRLTIGILALFAVATLPIAGLVIGIGLIMCAIGLAIKTQLGAEQG